MERHLIFQLQAPLLLLQTCGAGTGILMLEKQMLRLLQAMMLLLMSNGTRCRRDASVKGVTSVVRVPAIVRVAGRSHLHVMILNGHLLLLL